MITKTRQDWTPGQTVKVGFMTLVVKACIANIGDGQPDSYILTNTASPTVIFSQPLCGTKRYSAVPSVLVRM